MAEYNVMLRFVGELMMLLGGNGMIMDCYEYANLLNNLRPGDTDYNNTGLATLAAQKMREEGWERVGYNEYGEELMQSPANPLQQLIDAGELLARWFNLLVKHPAVQDRLRQQGLDAPGVYPTHLEVSQGMVLLVIKRWDEEESIDISDIVAVYFKE